MLPCYPGFWASDCMYLKKEASSDHWPLFQPLQLFPLTLKVTTTLSQIWDNFDTILIKLEKYEKNDQKDINFQ